MPENGRFFEKEACRFLTHMKKAQVRIVRGTICIGEIQAGG